MHGKIIHPAGIGRALNRPVPAQAQARWKILRVVQRPVDLAAASRAEERLAVVRTHLTIRQTGREDLNATARLDGEIRRAVVVVNGDVVVARALIIAIAKNVVQAVAPAVAIDADTPVAVGNIKHIIAVGVGVHILGEIRVVVGGIGVHADAHDVRAVGLDVADDVIGRKDGGKVLKHRLTGIETNASISL